jgi:hypothetical protein
MEGYSWINGTLYSLVKTTARALENPECLFNSHFRIQSFKDSFISSRAEKPIQSQKAFFIDNILS